MRQGGGGSVATISPERLCHMKGKGRLARFRQNTGPSHVPWDDRRCEREYSGEGAAPIVEPEPAYAVRAPDADTRHGYVTLKLALQSGIRLTSGKACQIPVSGGTIHAPPPTLPPAQLPFPFIDQYTDVPGGVVTTSQ